MGLKSSFLLSVAVLLSTWTTPAVAPWPKITEGANARQQNPGQNQHHTVPKALATPGTDDSTIVDLLAQWDSPEGDDETFSVSLPSISQPLAEKKNGFQGLTKSPFKHSGGDDADDVPDPSTYLTPGHAIGDDVLFAGDWRPLLMGTTRDEREHMKKERLPAYGDFDHVLVQPGYATQVNFRDLVAKPHVKNLIEKVKEVDSKLETLGVFEDGGYDDKITLTDCPVPTYVNWDQWSGPNEMYGIWKLSDYFEFLEYANRLLKDIEQTLGKATVQYRIMNSNSIQARSNPPLWTSRTPPSGTTTARGKPDPEIERAREEEKRMATISASKKSIDDVLQMLYDAGIFIENLLTYTSSTLGEMFPAADYSTGAKPTWEKKTVYDFLQYYDVRSAQTLLKSLEAEGSQKVMPKLSKSLMDLRTYIHTNPGFVWILVRSIAYEQHQWMVLAAAMYPNIKNYKLRVFEQFTTDNIQEIPISDKPYDLNGPTDFNIWKRRQDKKLLEGDLIPEKQLRNLIASVEPLFVMSSFMYRTSQRNRNRSPMCRFNAVLGEWLYKTYKNEYNEMREMFSKVTGREFRDVEAEYKGKIWLEGEDARQAKARKEDEQEAAAAKNRQQTRKKKKPLKNVLRGESSTLEQDYTRLLDGPELKEMLQQDSHQGLRQLADVLEQASFTEEVDIDQLLLTTARGREYRDRRPTEVLPRVQSPQWTEKLEKFTTEQRATTEAIPRRFNSGPDVMFFSEVYSPKERGRSRSPFSSNFPSTIEAPPSRPLSPTDAGTPNIANSFFGGGTSVRPPLKQDLNVDQFAPRDEQKRYMRTDNDVPWKRTGLQRRGQITEADDNEINDIVGFLPGQEPPQFEKLTPSRQLSSTSKLSSARTGINPMAQRVFISPRSYFSKQTTSKPGSQRDIIVGGMNDEYCDSVGLRSARIGGTADNTNVKSGLSMSNKPGSGMMKPSARSRDLINSKFEREENELPANHRDQGYRE